jgi:hypothetical protein
MQHIGNLIKNLTYGRESMDDEIHLIKFFKALLK